MGNGPRKEPTRPGSLTENPQPAPTIQPPPKSGEFAQPLEDGGRGFQRTGRRA